MKKPKVTAADFEIELVIKIQHGALAEGLRQNRWSQKFAAEKLEMSLQAFQDMLNLRHIPEFFTEAQIAGLFELTGQSVEELFPQHITNPSFLRKVKAIEYEVSVDNERRRSARIGIYHIPQNPEIALQLLELRETLHRALNDLPEIPAQVFRMIEIEDRSWTYVQRTLNLTHDEVTRERQKAFNLLRQSPHANELQQLMQ